MSIEAINATWQTHIFLYDRHYSLLSTIIQHCNILPVGTEYTIQQCNIIVLLKAILCDITATCAGRHYAEYSCHCNLTHSRSYLHAFIALPRLATIW